MSELQEDEERYNERVPIPLIVTIKEAAVDGHGGSNLEAPVKQARPRPMSEMHLGPSRLKGVYEDENGALRHLRVADYSARVNLLFSLTENETISAATNDLAQLINYLDLEATPDMTPMNGRSPSLMSPSEAGSPTKRHMTLASPIKTLRPSAASVSSLRLYAKIISLAPPRSIGQNIAS